MTLSLPSFTRFLVQAVGLLLLLGAGLLAQAQSNVTPAIRYVKPTAAGTGSGNSWANASGSLQAMINASVATDQVWVAAGTYKPGTDRNASFAMKIGVEIYGGFAGSETSLSQRPAINQTTPSNTILSGDIGTAGNIADNSYHVVKNPMDLINTAVLDGFIITGGNANGDGSAGGGIYNQGNDSGLGSSPTVRNCSFQNNSAGIGGAMYNYGSATSNPVLVNCSFRSNSAIVSGGSLYNYKNSGARGNPVLTNCSFQNNSAGTSGGAIFNVGYFSNCAPVLTNCSFQNNSAPQGGAFYNDGVQFYSRPQLTNCVLFGNGGSNSIRNSQDSYVEAAYSLFEADAAFTNGFLGSNVSGVTVSPFVSTNSVALNACAPAINSGNGDAYNSNNGTPTDLAGNARFYAGGPIDMGAVEFQAAPQSITITPPSASFATIGTTFNQTFSASGGSGPYILASGSLPPGITLATSGVLSGTPTQFGSYTFAVKVVDPVTGCSGLSAPYTLSVRSSKPIRYVKAGGTGNGDSWANASGDLQSQINVAGAEQVWVAAGTYKPGPAGNTDRIISFAMRGGVAIYGGFVGNETALSNRPTINPVRGNPSTTILSGDIGVVGNNSDNSYHVILNRDGLTSTAILDGFVITGGNANRDGYSYEGGGGMANICRPPAGAISPTVRNCSFQGNTATHGGAIFNDASGGQQECNPTLINCVFQDNSAGSGGAVSNNASNGTFCSPQFDNCYFINNTADNGGAMENFSGSRSQSNVRLTNCLFQSNSATSTGGAIYNAASGGSSSPVLINCSFQGNSIKAGAGSRLGGAIYFSTSGDITNAMLTNCSFQGNTASQGGAIYVESYQANSTTNINLISCVVFGNGGDGTFLGGRVAQDRYGLIYLSNTLIEASATRYQDRGGNILTNTSPFASPNSPELAANSPAVNAGSSDVQGTDVAGNPRIVGCRIDMGAYEFQYDPAVAITAQPAASSVVCGRASVSVPVGVSGQYLTYQWYKDSFANPVTGQTSATLTLANVQPANAGSYSLVVTGSCNSLTSTAFTLTVNQPTVSISPVSATICQGKSVLLTASGASTYTWSNTTTGNTLTATTAGTYSVTGVDGNGCANTATATLTENKPTVSISPVSATICQGKSVLLTASGASTYTWSNNTTDNTLSATTAGTYSVTGVDGNGCANTATATLTENKPTVSISPVSATICQGKSVLLTASGASTYTWSNNTTGNTLTATAPGTYSVTGVAVNGCFNSATAIVTDTRPSVSITASPSSTVTQGASVTLTASGSGLTSFAWVTGSTSNSTVINPTTSAPYSVTVRNGAGCVTVASLNITVTPIGCSPVIYVTQSGSGQRDGSSWANALGSSQLQFGINAAGCGGNGQVWVAAGVYKPTTGSDRTASFALRNGVTIYGGFVGNETAQADRPALNPVANRPASTTLSGDIGTVGNTGDNSFRVINNPSGLTTTAVLDGFVITAGAGGTLGGGMFNDGSSPTLRNCSFVSNSVSVSGSTISRGGAIYNSNGSSPQLYTCYFINNSASSLAGVNGFGGAMANLNSSNPQLTNCNFVNNRVLGNAGNQGGAIANNLNSSPQLINCSFLDNSASGGTGSRGGAVANGNGSNPQLINCSFLNNSVSGATSSTSNQGGAVYNNFCTPQLTNCVLFGNGGANTFYNVSGGSVVAYSLLEATVTSFTAGTGNLTTSVSPFVSATDVRLNGCSPAINAGDNEANTTDTDPDGNPRVYQNGRIDMGAYEYQGALSVVTTVPGVNTATVGVAYSQAFSASGGSGPYSYSLASGSLPPGLSVSNTGILSGTPTQSGSFTLTVLGQDATGCSGVSAPYVLTVTDANSTNPTLAGFTTSPGAVCAGSPVSFTANIGNVSGSYAYTLTNGLAPPLTGSASGSLFSQSITASGTDPQSFTLTVVANGQSASSVTALTVNPLPVATLVSSGTLSCSMTSVTLTAGSTAGVPGTSYTFTSGSGVLGTPGPANTVVVSTPGTYSVTVASASGCVSTTSTSVTANQTTPVVSIAPLGATLSCASPSVSLTALGSGSVRWSTGETSSVISVSIAGPYSVTATGGNGCTAVVSVSVSQDNAAPVASLVSSGSLTCSVTSVTLTASPGGQRYQFSTGATQVGSSNQAVASASGTYSVTVLSDNGCSSVASTSVSQDNITRIASLVSSGTLSCAVTSVTLTASAGGQLYRFSGGATQVGSSNQAVVSTSGLYSVTVVSGNGCSSVASVSVSQDNSAPVASLVSSGSLTCSVTSVTLTANPSGLSYQFSTGATRVGSSNQAVVSMAGIYSVTVLSGNGCSAVASTSVQSNTAVVTITNPTVNTATMGVAFSQPFTASGGNSPYSYSLVSGSLPTGLSLSTTGVLSGTPTQAGSFTLIVRSQDASSCLGVSVAYVLTVNAAASPNPTLTGLTASPGAVCAGSVATFTATVGNVTGSYTYTLTNGISVLRTGSASGSPFSQSVTAVGTGPQTFTLTVSVNGQSVSSETTLTVSPLPLASLINNGPLTCAQSSVTLTAGGAASVPGTSYTFTSGSGVLGTPGPANTVVVSTPGTYSVTVASASGCVSTTSTSVTADQTAPPVSINPRSVTLTCVSPTVSLTAVGSGTVRWSTGETTAVISVSVAGPYSVTVVSANGCSSIASTTVAGDVTVPEAGLTNNGPISCLMSLVTLTARGGDAYRFSNGATQVGNGPTAAVSTAGVYSVTVVSANGCTATASTTVVGDQTVPTASLTNNGPISCSVTSVTLVASGGSSYRFSNGANQIGNGPIATVTTAGVYSVTVVSGNGCSSVASTTVTGDQSVPVASLTNNGPISCSTTSVTLTASPNGQNYQFSAGATPIGTSNQAVVNASGTYSVTVVSGNGCSAVASTSVGQDNTAPVASLVSSGSLTCSVTSVTLTASPNGLSYVFSSGATQLGSSNQAVVDASGTYSVTVVSANGCSAVASVSVVKDQTAPVANLVSSGSLTCSVTSVTLTASPGGQTYRFSGGANQLGNTNQAVVSASGTYSVTVVSGNGCTAVASVSVSQDNTAPVASLVSSSSLTCSVTSVTLTASPSGQSYQFSAGATQLGSSNQAVVSASGIYSVTVLSGNGCTSVAQTTVESDQTVPTARIMPSSATLTCASPTVNLTAMGSGSVRWSTGETTPSISVRVAGIYSVTLTSGNGCTASANVVISQDQQVPIASIAANPSLTITQGQSATLTASATGGREPLGFRWSTGQTTPSIAVSVAGPYSVSVTGTNGCSATTSAVLSLTSGPVVEAPFAITAVTTLNCTPILPNRYSISFTPRYSGLTGQPIAFRVVNELLPTTEPGPYTIQFYTDNPRISLGAVQTGTPGEATFAYDWLAACLASTAVNTPPRLVTVIPPQSATVGVGYSYVIPQGTFTDDQTPGSLRLSAQGLPPGISLSGYTLSGVASTTVGSPFQVILTATDPGNLSVSTSFGFAVAPAPIELPQPSQPFAITGVSMLTCTPIADRININFSPRYVGLTGQPIAFRVENELAATNEPGPYSLTLYRDNPVIMLKATQTGSVGEASFTYNWLAACATQGQDNTPPRVVSPVGNQTVVVGTAVNLNLGNVFLDQETPQGLSLSATGLPAGLVLVGTAIQGVASTTGVSTVVVTATDGGGLSASTGFTLMVTAPVSPTVVGPGSFTITGVQALSCVVVSGGQRAVTFQPQYGGTNGGAINFSVVNERAATTDPGPYTLSLYTDNPTITLSAQQGSTVASYRYNWLAGCTPAARVGTGEASPRLTVRVLGNPIEGSTAEVEISGVDGQQADLELIDSQGTLRHQQVLERAGRIDRVTVPLGDPAGVLLVRVTAGNQRVTVKLLRR